MDGGFPKWISENKPTNREVLNFKPNKINFSYASKVEHNFAQRLVIKLIENLTGKRKLEKIPLNGYGLMIDGNNL